MGSRRRPDLALLRRAARLAAVVRASDGIDGGVPALRVHCVAVAVGANGDASLQQQLRGTGGLEGDRHGRHRGGGAAHGVPILVAALGLLLFCGLAMWHARWTWPGETPGILVPPENSPEELARNRIDRIYTIAAVFFCAALLGLLLL